MLERSQIIETNGVLQTVPHIYNSTWKEIYSDFTAFRFVQLTCMPSSIWNSGELEKNHQSSLILQYYLFV